MATIKIKQIKSKIGAPVDQKREALLLGVLLLVNWVLDLLRHVKRVSCQEKQLVHLMT